MLLDLKRRGLNVQPKLVFPTTRSGHSLRLLGFDAGVDQHLFPKLNFLL